jgi:S1-C subfamily serine protease
MLPTVLATSAMLASLSAQEPRTLSMRPGAVMSPEIRALSMFGAAEPRAVIGVSTHAAATSRDTLGVLVSEIQSGSPAEKAGLQEGDRIESVNGVSLKLAAADIGDEEMSGVLSRRLTRELDKLKPGDAVNLRVYSNGQTKSLNIKTVSPEDLYATPAMRAAADRATIGVSVGLNGSSRDSLGVFVMSVDDNGPAAKAGIAEGSRIASINGIDLRDHSGDNAREVSTSSVNKLQRELSKAKPGDDVELHVVYNGQSRTVKVKAARAADLPQRGRSVMIMGGNSMMLPEIATNLREIDGQRVGEVVRRAMDGVAGGVTNIRAFAGPGVVRW